MIQWFIDRRWGWHRVGLSSRYFSGDITHARLLQPRMRSLKRSEMCSTQILRPIPSARSTPRFCTELRWPFWCEHCEHVLLLSCHRVCDLTRNAPMRSVVKQLRKRPESQASDSILWRPGAAVRCPTWQDVRLLNHSETWWKWDLTKPTCIINLITCNLEAEPLCFPAKGVLLFFFYVEANKDFQVKYRSGE